MKIPRRSGKSNVYLVRCAEFLKIGVASSIAHRMIALRTGNPFDMDLIAYRPFDSAALADAAEARLHAAFDGKRHRGEWFVVSDEEAIEALRGISIEELTKPKMVAIHWMTYGARPAYSEEVPLDAVR